MPKRAIVTDQAAPAGGPYSHAVVAGDTIYLAGAIPARPDGTRVTGSFAEQAHAAFQNLAAVAEAAGGSLDQAVRVGVYLRDFGDFGDFDRIYAEYIKGDQLPVRTTLPVPLVGFDVEIEPSSTPEPDRFRYPPPGRQAPSERHPSPDRRATAGGFEAFDRRRRCPDLGDSA